MSENERLVKEVHRLKLEKKLEAARAREAATIEDKRLDSPVSGKKRPMDKELIVHSKFVEEKNLPKEIKKARKHAKEIKTQRTKIIPSKVGSIGEGENVNYGYVGF